MEMAFQKIQKMLKTETVQVAVTMKMKWKKQKI